MPEPFAAGNLPVSGDCPHHVCPFGVGQNNHPTLFCLFEPALRAEGGAGSLTQGAQQGDDVAARLTDGCKLILNGSVEAHSSAKSALLGLPTELQQGLKTPLARSCRQLRGNAARAGAAHAHTHA